MKRCTSCDEEKAPEQFGTDKRRKDGRAAKCRVCARVVTLAFFAKYPKAKAAQRMANAAASRAWYERNREREIDRMRWARAKRLYGLAADDYKAMLAKQDGACAICRTTLPGRKDQYFAVDHNHATNAVRGLLCQRCNSGLGYFRDNPSLMRRAAEYVEGDGA